MSPAGDPVLVRPWLSLAHPGQGLQRAVSGVGARARGAWRQIVCSGTRARAGHSLLLHRATVRWELPCLADDSSILQAGRTGVSTMHREVMIRASPPSGVRRAAPFMLPVVSYYTPYATGHPRKKKGTGIKMWSPLTFGSFISLTPRNRAGQPGQRGPCQGGHGGEREGTSSVRPSPQSVTPYPPSGMPSCEVYGKAPGGDWQQGMRVSERVCVWPSGWVGTWMVRASEMSAVVSGQATTLEHQHSNGQARMGNHQQLVMMGIRGSEPCSGCCSVNPRVVWCTL